MIRESEIEKYLVKQVAKAGGRAYKWVSPGNRGVPDRIIMLPGAKLCFAELKTRTGTLAAAQRIQKKTICGMGFSFAVIRSKADVNTVLTELMPKPKDPNRRDF